MSFGCAFGDQKEDHHFVRVKASKMNAFTHHLMPGIRAGTGGFYWNGFYWVFLENPLLAKMPKVGFSIIVVRVRDLGLGDRG